MRWGIALGVYTVYQCSKLETRYIKIIIMKHVYVVSCAGPESFQRDLTKYFFCFWLIRGEKINNETCISCLMRGSRKFSEGSNKVFFFVLVDTGREDPITTKIKLPFNGDSLASRWWPDIDCRLGSSVLFQGIRTSIAKEPHSSVIFLVCVGGGGQSRSSPHLWVRACV